MLRHRGDASQQKRARVGVARWAHGQLAVGGDSVTERIVRILETFSAERTVQTAADIGRRAGLPSSTAHRQVDALVEAGLLEPRRRPSRAPRHAPAASCLARLGRTAAAPGGHAVHGAGAGRDPRAPAARRARAGRSALPRATLVADSGANITRIAGCLPLHASSSGLVLLADGMPSFRSECSPACSRESRPRRSRMPQPSAACARRRAPRRIRRGPRFDRGGLDLVSPCPCGMPRVRSSQPCRWCSLVDAPTHPPVRSRSCGPRPPPASARPWPPTGAEDGPSGAPCCPSVPRCTRKRGSGSTRVTNEA